MYEINTAPLKRGIYNAFRLQKDSINNVYPPGYMMFPSDLDPKYFDQMTSERPKPVIKNGKIIRYDWEAHGPNEALDCTAYAKAALEVYIFEISQLAGEEASNYPKFWEYIESKFCKKENAKK
jgi:phage terminase large subunit GpA-like protein